MGFTRRVFLPVQEFIHTEWIGGVLLLGAAIVALAWANSPWSESYFHLWETHLALDLAVHEVDMSLHHWINDGLMALFFFVVGLEIKRELLHGSLSSPRRAALPILAAVGGMVVPAGLYWALNGAGSAGARGWGIPMATDIAFALGVLGLVGRSIPSQVRVFLLALAIVDDLGAILVIALFYTESVSLGALAVAGIFLLLIVAMRITGVRAPVGYAVAGVLVWLAVLDSGLHATLAGVLLGALTPSRPYVGLEDFQKVGRELVDRFEEAVAADDHDRIHATLGKMEELTMWTEAPLERIERKVHPWSAYFVLPVFALANSGVVLSGEAVGAAASSAVTLGVMSGLLLGKPLGVLAGAWIGVRSGWAEMPAAVLWRHVVGAGMLAAIGFTVALFITDLGFTDPVIIAEAKIGILAASVIAGGVGFAFLKATGGRGDPAEG